MNEHQKFVHVKNSGSKLKLHYNETSVKHISKFAQCDLKSFEYPEWDGTNADEYIRSLHKLPMNSDENGRCYMNSC